MPTLHHSSQSILTYVSIPLPVPPPIQTSIHDVATVHRLQNNVTPTSTTTRASCFAHNDLVFDRLLTNFLHLPHATRIFHSKTINHIAPFTGVIITRGSRFLTNMSFLNLYQKLYITRQNGKMKIPTLKRLMEQRRSMETE